MNRPIENTGSRARARRAPRALVAMGVAAAVLAVAAWIYPEPPMPWRVPPPAGAGPGGLTLLVAGDTGGYQRWPVLRSGQLAAARGMTELDLARPADAFLLLGDNFYPKGLEAERLVEQVRRNLVWPYCRFVALDGPRSGEVRDACTLPASLRRPIPMVALIGNHDLDTPGSIERQTRDLPRFVPNWRMAASPVEVWEPTPGLSVILVQSEALTPDDVPRVAAAIASSPGPWRIVAAHRPMALDAQGAAPKVLTARVRQAVLSAGVPVQAYLSGHDHSVRLVEGSSGEPPLQVIVGSGARPKPVRHHYRGERFARAAVGFAQLHLGRDRRQLTVTLFETPRRPIVCWRSPREVARARVDLGGAVAMEMGTPTGRAGSGGAPGR